MPDVPLKVQEELLVKSLHRCCICHHDDVHIHHIEGREGADPHQPDNLAPLCPNCHSRVEGKGGHGRCYTAGEVKRYRDNWLRNVEEFHKKAIPLAATGEAGSERLMAPGVPPSMQRLYLLADEASSVLSIDAAVYENRAIVTARALVGELLQQIELKQQRPEPVFKCMVAKAVEEASRMQAFTKIREMNHVLTDLARELRA